MFLFYPFVQQYFCYQWQGHEHDSWKPSLPLILVPAGVWPVHVGDHSGVDQSPDCHDVRHLPENPGE